MKHSLTIILFLCLTHLCHAQWRSGITITIYEDGRPFVISDDDIRSANVIRASNKQKQKNDKVKNSRVLLKKDAVISFSIVKREDSKDADYLSKYTLTLDPIDKDPTTVSAKVAQYFSVDVDGMVSVGKDSTNLCTVKYLVARNSETIASLDAGAIFVANNRTTYSLATALDSSGNPIPGTNVIVGTRNDRSITSALSGKVYFLFGEDQNGPVSTLQTVLSLGLHTDGGTRCGLFLGLSSNNQPTGTFQLGFSWFLDREEKMAISYGFNFAEGERLRSGFKPGDLVTLTNLDAVKVKTWEYGFFFAISFRAVGGK